MCWSVVDECCVVKQTARRRPPVGIREGGRGRPRSGGMTELALVLPAVGAAGLGVALALGSALRGGLATGGGAVRR
jgi:hypothetical protein